MDIQKNLITVALSVVRKILHLLEKVQSVLVKLYLKILKKILGLELIVIRLKKKGELDEIFKKVSENQFDILVGTQMLSKGHNFKNLSLVVVVDVDQRLYSPNLKALEHLAQLLIQVSGRAGRVNKRGKVLIQTNFPNNSDLQYLFKKDMMHGL